MLSQRCNRDGLDQVQPVLEHSGFRDWVARSPWTLHACHPEIFDWMPAKMWVSPLDRDLVLVHPPWCDFERLRRLHAVGQHFIEADRGEMESLAPANRNAIEPRLAVKSSGISRRARVSRTTASRSLMGHTAR